MPAAIQAPGDGGVPAKIRIRSTGLVQGSGGVGLSVSFILKSPSAASGCPPVLCGTSLPQNSVAATIVPPPRVPMLSLPARTRPFPSALMSPFSLTFASNLLITHGWPPGDTPRTTLRFTVQFVEPVAGVQAKIPSAVITPIPPSNSTRVPAIADGARIIIPRTTLMSPIDRCFMVGPPFPRVAPSDQDHSLPGRDGCPRDLVTNLE